MLKDLAGKARDGGSLLGYAPEAFADMAAMGWAGVVVPEACGGMGMNELDFILLAQECGYAGLPEPLVDTMLVGVPLLAALDA